MIMEIAQQVRNIQIRENLVLVKNHLLSAFHFIRKYVIYLLTSFEPTVRPGQPRSSDIGVDSICLEWDGVESHDVTHYEIRMKLTADNSWSKKVVSTQDRTPSYRVRDLVQNTGYEFMTRAVYSDGRTSEFGIKSVEIKTKCSELQTLLKVCRQIDDGPPSVHKLPLEEFRESEDNILKTRKYVFGTSTCKREKTILLVGPTKAGKSTLTEGLVNYSLGVSWEDNFRFTITDELPTNKVSHTEWITCYKVHPIMESCEFILNIIDTPSFHDESASTELIQRLKTFLSGDGPKGLNRGIDAVCFVLPANPTETSGADTYLRELFDSIVSIGGRNIVENIIPTLTFADGKDPLMLEHLSAAGIPTQSYFVFNLSTLFPPYTKDDQLGKTLWQFRSRGYEKFLGHLPSLKPCRVKENQPSKPQTNPSDQQAMMTQLQGNRLQIDVKLMDLATVKSDRDTVKKFAVDIGLNKSFSYDEHVYHQEKIPLDPGTHVTNCILCHTTCHYPCSIPDNAGKIGCAAMNNGNCTVCHQKCVWHMHRNDTFRIETKVTTVTRTYEGLKAKYEFGTTDSVPADDMLVAIKRAFVSLLEDVIALISKTVQSSNDLQGIHNTEKDFIELMINTEEQEKRAGFEKRLELLRAIRNNSTVSVSDPNTWLRDMGFNDW